MRRGGGGVVWSWLLQPEATAFNLFFLSAGLPGPIAHAGAVACPAWRWHGERGRPPSPRLPSGPLLFPRAQWRVVLSPLRVRSE